MAFKEIETQALPDIQSVGTMYEHEETGAHVLYIANDDSNKAFTIGFKTPPYNDNGIAHILEHSVLNGSEKYPSKEPFVELIKGSLNTFVNAMTFSDKTIYPVASTNQKDFKHLMGVYLDAVFKPKLYNDPQILEQEGWHYHLESPEDELIYKGVVYNEMKGATASPERQVYNHLTSQLYPNSIYAYESGGDPKAIPSLTQDEFIQFHQTYYHPSQSLTVLYGDLDINEAFDALEEYFGGVGNEKADIDLSVEMTQPSDEVFEDTYSITEGDNPEGKDYLALGWHVAEPDDALNSYGLKVLAEILFGNNQSPLKKALLDAEIGGDINGDSDEIGFPTAFMIMAKYSDAKKMDQFKQVVNDTLTDLVNKGLDKELIQAAINKITFQTKESVISEDSPRGVIYAITAYSTWLYDKSPYVNLSFSQYLEELARLAEDGYFENLIKEKLLDNPMRIAIALKAEPGKNDRLEAETHKKLQEYKATLSEDEINEIVSKTQALIKRQETPDKPEDLAKIPTLTREDMTTDTEDYPIEVSPFGEGTSFYHTPQFTSGIDYVGLYFDIKDFEAEDYKQLSFLSSLLSELRVSSYDSATLQRQIDLHTGGIYGTVSVYEDTQGELKPYFILQGKALEDSLDQLLALMKDIVTDTQFDEQSDILKLTQRFISSFEQKVNFRAHTIAAVRALSQIKSVAKLEELTDGIDQFNYLKETRDGLQSNDFAKISQELALTLSRLMNKKRLNVVYTGAQDRGKLVKEKLERVFADLPSQELEESAVIEAGQRQNEAFVTAQDVNYVAKAADAKGILDYNGVANFLSTVFRYEFLWNEIRVKGGAYGSLYRHGRNGSFKLASYRDPNISKTLDVYNKLPEFVANLDLSESELVKYIIGTLSPLEQPQSAISKGVTAFGRLQRGLTSQDIVRLKEEILAVEANDLNTLADQYREVLEESTITVIGNKSQIEKEKDLFDEIYDLY
ncbi:insulinase family protein [Alkalibacterium sp. MB6]|uniref:insulinase family protein n=1 Tax=Alkalibacterium sp. MB6 TaxID=2081965 RepID=UPI0013797779|nr:insulinase family protein [Alkalibacterium sp. MB6]